MEQKKLPRLPDYGSCLVNLSNSILKKFGAETAAGTLPLADRYLAKKNSRFTRKAYLCKTKSKGF